MSRKFNAFLLDIATRIAPKRCRDWIEGIRAETAMADRPMSWAWGAVSTALHQRIADTLSSGLALRIILGGYILFTLVRFTVYVRLLISHPIGNSVVVTGMFLPMAVAGVMLLSGGLAILFSPGRPWFNRYGRAVFALGALAMCLGTIDVPRHFHPRFHSFVHEIALVATALLIIAALAQLFRRPRLFVLSVLGVFGLLILQGWGIYQTVDPALLLLTGTGLLVGPKRISAIRG